MCYSLRQVPSWIQPEKWFISKGIRVIIPYLPGQLEPVIKTVTLRCTLQVKGYTFKAYNTLLQMTNSKYKRYRRKMLWIFKTYFGYFDLAGGSI